MRTLAALTGLVCLAAGPAQEVGFEILITGDIEATLADTDARARRSMHPSGQGTELRVELDDDTRDNCTLILQANVGGAEQGDEEGTYELADLITGGLEASRATLVCESLEIRSAQSKEGSLVIDTADDTGIVGELDFTAEAMLLGSSEPVSIRVAGEFTAEWSDY